MELDHSFTIPVSPEQAWQVLLDVERVAPCMPGATVDSVDDDVVSGKVKVKVGPVALTYSGKARFTERDEQARSITLEASGKETRGAGTASATVHSWLEDEGGQTRVNVHTTMNVTGRPAQFGRGVMADVGGKIIEKFASNLAVQCAGGVQAEAGPPAGPAGSGDGPRTAGSGQGSGTAGSAEGSGAAGSGDGSGAAATGDGALALPIEDLQLPVRAFNSLRREGIHTVRDLSARNEAELRAIPNLGSQSINEIKRKLSERGLGLASAPAEKKPAAAGSDGGTAVAARPPTTSAPATPPPAASPVTPTPVTEAPATPSMVTPPAARPPDEDAIDLLSVAGFPVLKRMLPAVGVVAVLVMLLLFGRRRRHRRG
jgi:carbon monoxide dehydrogenase subunit G